MGCLIRWDCFGVVGKSRTTIWPIIQAEKAQIMRRRGGLFLAPSLRWFCSNWWRNEFSMSSQPLMPRTVPFSKAQEVVSTEHLKPSICHCKNHPVPAVWPIQTCMYLTLCQAQKNPIIIFCWNKVNNYAMMNEIWLFALARLMVELCATSRQSKENLLV